jgi:hypothetical protein
LILFLLRILKSVECADIAVVLSTSVRLRNTNKLVADRHQQAVRGRLINQR